MPETFLDVSVVGDNRRSVPATLSDVANQIAEGDVTVSARPHRGAPCHVDSRHSQARVARIGSA